MALSGILLSKSYYTARFVRIINDFDSQYYAFNIKSHDGAQFVEELPDAGLQSEVNSFPGSHVNLGSVQWTSASATCCCVGFMLIRGGPLVVV